MEDRVALKLLRPLHFSYAGDPAEIADQTRQVADVLAHALVDGRLREARQRGGADLDRRRDMCTRSRDVGCDIEGLLGVGAVDALDVARDGLGQAEQPQRLRGGPAVDHHDLPRSGIRGLAHGGQPFREPVRQLS